MRLYHGSNTDIKEINLEMCRPYKDFGRGFYLTVMEEQAEKMAKRVARIYGGYPVLNIYELDDSFMQMEDLCIKDFGKETSEEWARFVRNNRDRKFADFSDPECPPLTDEQLARLRPAKEVHPEWFKPSNN